MAGLVNWYEGQFLQPHQFQIDQRQALEARRDERKLLLPFDYGVIEARLSRDALASKRVRFDRLVAVMRSGLLIDVPGNTELNELDIGERFGDTSDPLVVKLGLPTYAPGKANTVGLTDRDRGVDRIFREAEVRNVADDNTGENEQAVLVRRFNARLELESRAVERHMEWLPVLRISRSQTAQRQAIAVEDPDWFPTCLTLHGSGELARRVGELALTLEKTRSDLAADLRPGYKGDALKPDQTVKLLRLRALANAVVALRAAERGRGAPMHELYRAMSGIMADLGSLSPEHDPFAEVPRYDHDQPALWFPTMDDLIRRWRWPKDRDRYRKIKLVRTERPNISRGEFKEEDVVGVTDYFVGVRSPLAEEAVRKLVENTSLFKLVPRSQEGDDTAGVSLALTRRVEELPVENGLLYFRVQRGAEDSAKGRQMSSLDLDRWQRIITERRFSVVVVGADLVDRIPDIALYVTIP
jgi:type VI secretion system ImpJ/VasE family protein